MILKLNCSSIGKITIPQCINLVIRTRKKQCGELEGDKMVGAI